MKLWIRVTFVCAYVADTCIVKVVYKWGTIQTRPDIAVILRNFRLIIYSIINLYLDM